MPSFRLFKRNVASTIVTILITLQFSACSTEESFGYSGKSSSGTSSTNVILIELPTCDQANPEVRFIEKNEDWADINEPSYRVFCVLPGDYTDLGTIYITADGEDGNERWIRLYDPQAPNDESTHPVDVDDTRRAIVERFNFGHEGDPATNWFVDRITKRGGSLVVWKGSERIVLNRLLMEHGHQALFAVLNAKDATLQNSVLRQTEIVPNADRHCIIIGQNSHGTQIINNEIYDCAGDGIQFGPNSGGGAVILNNDIYLTPVMYSDCQGNLDPNGSCACAENAIDLKGPGEAVRPFPLPEKDWVQIKHNIIWGFRPTDSSCGGTGSPGQSVSIGSGADNYVSYVLIRDNIIMDGPSGIEIGLATVDHISIISNIIYGMTKNLPDSYYGAITNLGGDAIEIYLNTIINATYWLRIGPNADQNDVLCNIAIDGNARPFSSEMYDDVSVVDYNFFYNTVEYTTEGLQNHDLVFNLVTDAKHSDYCFYRSQWTGPLQVCIPYSLATVESPHHNACDSNIGQRTGIGVSDGIF